MRINLFQTNLSQKLDNKKSLNYTTPPQYKNIELSNIYYKPLSFGCSGIDFNNQMESLSGVHCPCCGTKMLNKEEYETLLEKSKQVQTKEEFIDLLNEYSENVPYKLKPIVKYINKVNSDKPELSLNHLIAIVKSGANKKIGYNIEYSSNTLLEFSKDDSFSENDKNLLISCSKKLNEFKESKRNRDEFRAILNETILKMESDRKHKIFVEVSRDFAKHNFRRMVLSGVNLSESDINTISQILIRNIFVHSISKVNKVNDINNDININFDKMLMCSNCANDNFSVSNMLQGDEKSLFNYQTYMDDISLKYATKEMDIEHSYPSAINGLVKKHSNGKLYKNDKSEAALKLRTRNFELNQEIDFDLVHVDGVPCLGCGQDTITHETKLEIYKKLAQAKNKREMLDVLLENKHVIKERFIKILDFLDKILKEQPNISDEDALKILRQAAHDDIQEKLLEGLKYVRFVYQKPHLLLQDKELVRNFIINFKKDFLNTDSQKPFPFKEYGELLNDTFGKMINTNNHKHIENLKYSIKDKFGAQYILFPPPTVLEKYDSIFEIILQDIIRRSVVTKDHFTAKGLAGSNEKKNIIILCRECNQYKSNSKVWNWIIRNPNFEKYATKYFEFIGNKVKSGKINPDNLDYLIDLQKNILELTRGEIYIDFNPNNFVI